MKEKKKKIQNWKGMKIYTGKKKMNDKKGKHTQLKK